MASDSGNASSFSLRRWSARKLQATRDARRASSTDANPEGVGLPQTSQLEARTEVDERANALAPCAPKDAALAVEGASQVASESPSSVGQSDPAQLAPSQPGVPHAVPSAAASLPPIDTLTIDSDYAPFMRAGDESLKRSALKKLFSDPRFNVMDGLDVYIDDYSKPDPISPDIVRTLVQARYIFNPPKTQVNEQGCVEDVVDDISAPPCGDDPAVPAKAEEVAAHDEEAGPVAGDVLAPASPVGASTAVLRSPDALVESEALDEQGRQLGQRAAVIDPAQA